MIDKIKIGGIIFKIKCVKKLIGANNVKYDGWVKHSKSHIKIEKNLEIQCYLQTLFHEIFHAIFTHLGREDDEKTVDSLAYSMLQVLRDNPQLLEAIKELDK